MKSERMLDEVCAVVLNKLQTILRFCSQNMMIGRFSLCQTEHSVATRQECLHFDRMQLTSTFHVSRLKFQDVPKTRIYFQKWKQKVVCGLSFININNKLPLFQCQLLKHVSWRDSKKSLKGMSNPRITKSP